LGRTRPSPLTVFDGGAGFVEAGYEDGDDTVVATVDPKTLVASSTRPDVEGTSSRRAGMESATYAPATSAGSGKAQKTMADARDGSSVGETAELVSKARWGHVLGSGTPHEERPRSRRLEVHRPLCFEAATRARGSAR
jgi:hypothetical protein